MKRDIEVALDSREHATILAALRFWQEFGTLECRVDAIHDIASNGGTVEPLTAAEIDSLCEWIN